MIAPLSKLFPDTSLGFVATAAVVCLTMSATVVILLRQAEASEGRQRALCMALIVAVAGLGVWTTHFVAMLGWRPDAMLAYGVQTTLLSAAVGLVAIGGPLAASCGARGRAGRTLWGGIAGAGVAAMHFTGMRALEGCVALFAPPYVTAAVVTGIAGFAGALAVGGRHAGLWKTLLLVAGVCALHFTAMAGVTIELISEAASRATLDTHLLSALVATASLGLSVASCGSILAGRRLRDQKRTAAEAEARQNRMFSLAMKNMSNGLVMIDGDGRVVAFNGRAEELLALEPGALAAGRRFEEAMAPIAREVGCDARGFCRPLTEADETTHRETVLGNGKVLRISSRPLPDEGVVVTFDDVTERHSAERAMTQLAYRDTLTGLPNRRSFLEALNRSIGDGRGTAVVLLDLDRFKQINETLGHQVGDKLLAKVAGRLADALEDDRLFRLGGDELAVLPSADGAEDAEACARLLLEAFDAPFCLEGQRIHIGCSAGLALAEPGDDADLLLQKADLALYRAKGRGGRRVAAYEDGMMEAARERRELEIDLAHAAERGQLRLEYQPLFRLPDKRLVGFEALVRWHHPKRGPVPPAEFIPLAEECGTIAGIGRWVLDTACRQISGWPEHVHVAVNVSAVEMRAPDVVDQIAAALRRHGVPSSRLELELTETAMVEDGERIAASLRALRRLGVKIAMDDFGTGYSSFAHLRAFELDRIKIDRSFVSAADSDTEARAMVRAVTGMAREMKIMTVGEGVETQQQLDRLIELGCNHVQGFYLGRPMDASAAGRLIAVQCFDEDAEAERGSGAARGRTVRRTA